MPSPRDLGTIPVLKTQENVLVEAAFVKIELPSPVGVVRFTNLHCGASGEIDLDIDGATETWKEYDVEVGDITESGEDETTLSWLRFANLAAFNGFDDKQFTKWANSPGLRKVPVDIYLAQFNPATGALLGSFLYFPGEFDGGEFDTYAQIVVKQRDTPWAKIIPYGRVSPTCVYVQNYRGVDCAYAGAEPGGQTTCGGTRADCELRSNQARFGGFDLMPPLGHEIEWI